MFLPWLATAVVLSERAYSGKKKERMPWRSPARRVAWEKGHNCLCALHSLRHEIQFTES